MTTYRIIVRGFVQGVGFRYHARQTAVELNLTGYAKNVGEDNVEIVAQGNDNDIEELVRWCRVGPDNSRVESVDISEIETAKKYETFTIEY